MEIRLLQEKDWESLEKVYKRAFAGFPWYENLSKKEVRHRLDAQETKRGFSGLVAVEGGRVIGGIWWDNPTIAELATERGELLVQFASKEIVGYESAVIWERELLVDPDYQGRGIATVLRQSFIGNLCQQGDFLILTRMRDDNIPTIRIAEKLGYRRTGIRVPSSQKSGVCHEFWFLEV